MNNESDHEIEHRVDRLEREVERLREQLEGRQADAASAAAAEPEASDAPADPLWFVNTLGRYAPGVVMMAGAVEVPAGPVRWQYGLHADDLLARDWSELARPVEALGHPVRLELVRRILNGTQTTAELLELDQFASSGQLYHHLRQLVSAGWLTSPRRGHYEVPVSRIVPLLVLTMIAAS
ncbi:Helix-turn-helix domain protein [Microbacterium hydrocarbonoxydans]|uniref:Helix-turn-helix domain protein n=1 Tax=Microbacterium hydrocarbonoxydans TaxID=273678 RepID=A0A0M2HGX9_9MICO|nr:helix-turn-helix domain-containing protein [Microbacterium hydrocarbonoxydans]KJL45944.1 Helix-turn-helix domain protein [Microbacterium hydrocarbonoxydans]